MTTPSPHHYLLHDSPKLLQIHKISPCSSGSGSGSVALWKWYGTRVIHFSRGPLPPVLPWLVSTASVYQYTDGTEQASTSTLSPLLRASAPTHASRRAVGPHPLLFALFSSFIYICIQTTQRKNIDIDGKNKNKKGCFGKKEKRKNRRLTFKNILKHVLFFLRKIPSFQLHCFII